MSDGAAGMKYQPGLDGLRAIAVIGVVMYHLGYGWARGGFLGVDTFFVLSGYLITTLLLIERRDRSGIALAPFWGRRLRRLLPALLLVLLAVAVAAVSFVPTTELGRLRADALSGLFYVANWRFVLSGQSYFDLFSAPSPLRHLWSLAIEEQFYLVWPVVVLVALRVGRGTRTTLVGVCVLGIGASVAAMAWLYSPVDPSRVYYGTDARAHTLLVGCLLAIALQWRPLTSTRASKAVSVVGSAAFLGLLAALIVVSDHSSGLYHGGSLAFALLVVPIIAASATGARGPMYSVLSLPLLRWIGRLSYGIYLWHWPMIIWMTPDRTHMNGLTLDAARIAATLTLATLSFYLVERPIRRTEFSSLRVRALVPVSVVVVALALVGATASAEAPPGFLGAGAASPSRCSATAAEERAVEHVLGPTPATVPHRVTHRLLLIGDSTACSMFLALHDVGASLGVEVVDASVVGCGVVSGTVSAILVPPWTSKCQDFVTQTEEHALAIVHPDIVVWASAWERFSLVEPHRIFASGTAAWADRLETRMDRLLPSLVATGAHLYIATQPPFATGINLIPGSEFGKTMTATRAQDQVFIRLNGVIRRFAQRHPTDVTMLDLSAFVCRGESPCPTTVDNIRPRPIDGSHYSAAGSVWVARWLLPKVLPK